MDSINTLKSKYMNFVAIVFCLYLTTLLLFVIQPQTTYANEFGQHITAHPEIYTEDYIFDTETFYDPFYEGIFVTSIENEVNKFYMPRLDELSDNAFWNLFNMLVYKYFPEAFYHGYNYMEYEDIDLIYISYIIKDEKKHFYYNITDEAYRLMKDDALDKEYEEYINSVIKNAGINVENIDINIEMNHEQMVNQLIRYLSEVSIYDVNKYYEIMNHGDVAYWMINRDYGIGLCASDSRIFKSCMNKLGIPCNIVEYPGHLYNQVYINGKWRGVDITGFRQYGYFYDNFDDMEWYEQEGIDVIYR